MNLLKGFFKGKKKNHTNIKGLPPPHLHRCTDTTPPNKLYNTPTKVGLNTPPPIYGIIHHEQ